MAEAFKRIISIASVHAHFAAFFDMLRKLEIIDSTGNLIARDTAVVQLGNVCDRGPDSRRVFDLLMKLQKNASKRGCRVYVLLGKHECLNLFGLHQQATDAERHGYDTRAGGSDPGVESDPGVSGEHSGEAHREAFAPGGWVSNWICRQPAMVRVAPFIFGTADLPYVYKDSQFSEINEHVHDEIARHRAEFRSQRADLPLSLFSPETSVLCCNLAGSDDIPEYASAFGRFLKNNRAAVYVCGSTPQTRGKFLKRFGGRYLCIDTGLAFESQGFGSRTALEWHAGETWEVHFDGDAIDRRLLDLPSEPPE